jgi:hypothetical protein
LLDGSVTVAAVDAEIPGVMLVAEGDWLFTDDANARHIRGPG